jgi:hypothetical protein
MIVEYATIYEYYLKREEVKYKELVLSISIIIGRQDSGR